MMDQKMALTTLLVLISLNFVSMLVMEPENSVQLEKCLETASNGDIIKLLPIIYVGDFVIKKDADPANPITLIGQHNSTLQGKSVTDHGQGNVLKVTASNWILRNFIVIGHQDFLSRGTGISVDGTHNSLISLVLRQVQNGIVLNSNGDCQVQSCVIAEIPPTGVGISVLSGQQVSIINNVVNGQGQSILVDTNSCCGQLTRNVVQSLILIKGMRYTIQNNVGNSGLEITGCDNSIQGNIIQGATMLSKCRLSNFGGNIINGQIMDLSNAFQNFEIHSNPSINFPPGFPFNQPQLQLPQVQLPQINFNPFFNNFVFSKPFQFPTFKPIVFNFKRFRPLNFDGNTNEDNDELLESKY